MGRNPLLSAPLCGVENNTGGPGRHKPARRRTSTIFLVASTLFGIGTLVCAFVPPDNPLCLDGPWVHIVAAGGAVLIVSRRLPVAAASGITIAAVVGVEIAQPITGRQTDVWDVMWGCGGIALAATVIGTARALRAIRNRNRNPRSEKRSLVR